MHEFSHWSPHAAHGVLALFGALVHALDAHRKGTSKSVTDFFSLVVMSSFSGVMFALVALMWFPDNSYLTAAMAGTGGYVGVEGMSWVRKIISSRFQ